MWDFAHDRRPQNSGGNCLIPLTNIKPLITVPPRAEKGKIKISRSIARTRMQKAEEILRLKPTEVLNSSAKILERIEIRA